MNESERRRRQLLDKTRRMYSDRRELPAVHPRFGATYGRLYEEEDVQTGTFGVRLFLCLLLFAAFVTMDKQEYQVFQMDSEAIVEEIGANLDMKETVREVWNRL